MVKKVLSKIYIPVCVFLICFGAGYGLAEYRSEKDSAALAGCELVAVQVHDMLSQCEYEHEIWKGRAEQCRSLIEGLFTE